MLIRPRIQHLMCRWVVIRVPTDLRFLWSQDTTGLHCSNLSYNSALSRDPDAALRACTNGTGNQRGAWSENASGTTVYSPGLLTDTRRRPIHSLASRRSRNRRACSVSLGPTYQGSGDSGAPAAHFSPRTEPDNATANPLGGIGRGSQPASGLAARVSATACPRRHPHDLERASAPTRRRFWSSRRVPQMQTTWEVCRPS